MSGMRIVLFGYYGMGNLGDELMLDGLLHQLVAAPAVSAITVFVERDYYQPLPKTTFVTSRGFNKLRRLKAIADADLVCWGGGTFAYEGVEKEGLLWLRKIQMICRSLAKPFALLNVGLSPVAAPDTRRVAAKIVSEAEYLSLREESSVAVLVESFGISEGYELGGDLAAIRTDAPGPAAEPQGKVARLSFSGADCGTDEAAEHWGRVLARVARELGAKIHFLPAHILNNDDNLFHRKVARALPPGSFEIHELEHPLHYLPILQGMDFHLGMRLHSVIAADLYGIPNAGIAYQPKVSYYLEKTGMLAARRDLPLDAAFAPADLLAIRAGYRKPEAFLAREREASSRCIEAMLARFSRR